MYNPYNPEANTLDETIRNLKKFLMVQKIASGSIRSYLSDTRFFFNWLTEFLVSKKIIEGSSVILRNPADGGMTKNPDDDNGITSQTGNSTSSTGSFAPLRMTGKGGILRRSTPQDDICSFATILPGIRVDSHLEITTLLKYVNEPVLNAYKDSLEAGNIPVKTINRRFSALRKFGSFCLAQNWIAFNLFDTLRNISQNTPFPEFEYHLEEFKANLWKNKATKSTLKNYLNDSKQFLLWSKTRARTI